MPSRIQNKVKLVLYRPRKARPHFDFTAEKLDEIEKTLNDTIGGIFKKKQPKKKNKEKGKSEE